MEDEEEAFTGDLGQIGSIQKPSRDNEHSQFHCLTNGQWTQSIIRGN